MPTEGGSSLRQLTYKTRGTCSRYIHIGVNEEGIVDEVRFDGGCDGNTKGICALVKGMRAKEVKERLRGVTCQTKPTSCPDQLARALEEMGY